MCEKCVELEQKIEHYHRLIARMLDAQTNDALRRLIEEMGSTKRGFTRSKSGKKTPQRWGSNWGRGRSRKFNSEGPQKPVHLFTQEPTFCMGVERSPEAPRAGSAIPAR